jgi:hypothetical protein
MAGQFEATVEIDRPIAEVFAFLAEGTNDPKFSPRVQRIDKKPEGPTAVGTVFVSTVKDAGFALSMARKDAPAFGNRIKAAIEAS